MAKYDIKSLGKNTAVKAALREAKKNAEGSNIVGSETRIINIPFEKIKANPLNKDLPMDDLDQLKESIRTGKLLHEILVYDMHDGTYQILSGHRRYAALKQLAEEGYDKYPEVPCKVIPYEENEEIRLQQHYDANADTRDKDARFLAAELDKFLDTIQRMNPQMRKDDQMTIASEKMHYSKSHLYRLYSLQNLDASLMELNNEKYGKISLSTLQLAAALPIEDQKKLAVKVKTRLMEIDQQTENGIRSDISFTRDDFQKMVNEIKGKPEKKREVNHFSYAERIRNNSNATLTWFSAEKVLTSEDRDAALKEISALEDKLKESREALEEMKF